MSIYVRLKEERLKAGLTQADMAEVGGVSISSQKNYEAGRRAMDSEYLERVQEVVDVSYIITGKTAIDPVKAMTLFMQLADQFDLSELPAERIEDMCLYIYKSNASYSEMAAAFKAVGVAERPAKYVTSE